MPYAAMSSGISLYRKNREDRLPVIFYGTVPLGTNLDLLKHDPPMVHDFPV
jgi:hypothetical protein